jgi:hypothetical protein
VRARRGRLGIDSAAVESALAELVALDLEAPDGSAASPPREPVGRESEAFFTEDPDVVFCVLDGPLGGSAGRGPVVSSVGSPVPARCEEGPSDERLDG